MGSAASLNEYNVDAQIQNRYRQEIAALFVEEYYRLQRKSAAGSRRNGGGDMMSTGGGARAGAGMTSEELKAEFIDILQEKEPAILTKIGLSSNNHATTKNEEKKCDSGNGYGSGYSSSSGYPLNSLDEETEFRQLCVDTVDNIRSKNTMVYMCCLDGSESANIAFRTMMRLKKRLDHINIFHAYSKSKNMTFASLAATAAPGAGAGAAGGSFSDFHSSAIQQFYESELISTYRVPVNRFHFDFIERKNKSVVDIFQNLLDGYQARDHRLLTSSAASSSGSGSADDASSSLTTGTGPQPHFLFIGYVGRKGQKKGSGGAGRGRGRGRGGHHDDEDEDEDESGGGVMGSFTEYCMFHAYMPIIICKSLCPQTQRLFILAVDGSPLCKRGFDICLTLINPKDSLRIVNVYNPRKTGTGCEPPPDEIEEFYNHEIESFGPYDSTFTTVTCPVGSSIASCLVEFSNNVGGDFFILSPRTRRYMSATVEHVIAHCQASIILCKN
jgi:hypothetical protein